MFLEAMIIDEIEEEMILQFVHWMRSTFSTLLFTEIICFNMIFKMEIMKINCWWIKKVLHFFCWKTKLLPHFFAASTINSMKKLLPHFFAASASTSLKKPLLLPFSSKTNRTASASHGWQEIWKTINFMLP